MSGRITSTCLLFMGLLWMGMTLAPGDVSAVTLDLTAGTEGVINGATFSTLESSHPAGTGVFDPFLRTGQGNAYPTDEGYNTDGRPLDLDQYSDPNYTRSLLLSDLMAVNGYYVFELDIDQTAHESLISLDKLEIYQLGAPDVLGLSNVQAGFLVYDLDAGGNNSITLDYNLRGSGQGTSDMLAFIPTSFFNAAQGEYVYLYSLFGDNYANNDGPQEWRALTGEAPPPVPEPSTFLLLGSSLVGLAILRKKSKNA